MALDEAVFPVNPIASDCVLAGVGDGTQVERIERASLTVALPLNEMVGTTLLTAYVNVAVAAAFWLSVAVIVTVVGPAGPSAAFSDQLQVPLALFCVTVPNAVMFTVLLPCGSENVPLFVAVRLRGCSLQRCLMRQRAADWLAAWC